MEESVKKKKRKEKRVAVSSKGAARFFFFCFANLVLLSGALEHISEIADIFFRSGFWGR